MPGAYAWVTLTLRPEIGVVLPSPHVTTPVIGSALLLAGSETVNATDTAFEAHAVPGGWVTVNALIVGATLLMTTVAVYSFVPPSLSRMVPFTVRVPLSVVAQLLVAVGPKAP